MKKKSSDYFRGARTSIEVKGYNGISRNVVWNIDKEKYESPKRGKLYLAHRYVAVGSRRKREVKHFDTIEEARQWQVNTQSSVMSSRTTKENLSPSLGEVIELWKNSWHSLAINTKLQYKKCLPFYDTLLSMKIESISAQEIDSLILAWRTRKGGYRAIRTSFEKELETLTYIFSWYNKNFDQSKGHNPFKDRHWKNIVLKKKVKPKRKHMSDEEIDAFLNALAEDSKMYYALAFTQLYQVMRVSETAAMTRVNLDSKSKTYMLDSHVIWPRHQEEGLEPRIELGTKNIAAGDVHTMHLFNEVAMILESLPKHPGVDLLFHDNGKILTYRQIQYRYDKAFKKANLPFSATHVLRHSGSTSFYNATGDLLALQQMGAWSNSRMPQHYAKIMSTRAKEAIAKIQMRPKLKMIK